MSRLGTSRLCEASHGSAGVVAQGPLRNGLASPGRQGTVSQRKSWPVVVSLGGAGLLGNARRGRHGMAWFGASLLRKAWLGRARQASHGQARLGAFWFGVAWSVF